ncbi:vWA domain-containing protein [Rossellomorea aquimaris]|uniref:vWA domain-containing protein n=1 Tax=Rossellomorea aquimaris TaxID=189382 RepID=UPI001CFE7027|nr:VWA domain-containing protein [Rossellomorea aquimaris]
MGIGNPLFFLFSFFIAAVILMYFFRKQYRDHTVPSNLLWEEVMKEWQASPWFHRLQKNLLLLLQVLILLLLMLALVNPYTEGQMAQKGHVIVLLDTSASMNASVNGQTHLELAKEEIRSLIKDTKGDITILGVGSSVSTITSREKNDQVAVDHLQQMSLTNDHEDMMKALSLGQALGKGSQSIIHVYSDSVTKRDFTKDKVTTPIQVHNLLPEAKNVSLASFGVERVGTFYQGVAVIENQSRNIQMGKITIFDDEKMIASKNLEIEAGKEAVVSLPELPESPVYKAEIAFKDDFKMDNVLESIQAISKPPISVVGELNPFLLKGFQSLGVDVKTVEEDQVKLDDGIIVTTNEQWEGLSLKNPAMIIPESSEKSNTLSSEVNVRGEDPLLKHVDLEKVFVEKASSIDRKGLDTLAESDSVPLVQKGEEEGIRLVVLNMHLNDTDFPLHAGFPLFLHNVYQFLSEDQGFIGYFQPGEVRTISLSGGEWDIYTADDEFIKESELDERFKAPLIPGLYKAVQGEAIKYFSVRLDEREKRLGSESYTLNPSEGNGGKEEKAVPETLSSLLLMLAVLVLFIEWEVYRRGSRI